MVDGDELGIRDLLSEIPNDEGHSVELAENATQAEPPGQNSYDLVLLDIWMPTPDGTCWHKGMGDGGRVLTMPVIMMSAATPPSDTAVEPRVGLLVPRNPSPSKAAQGRGAGQSAMPPTRPLPWPPSLRPQPPS